MEGEIGEHARELIVDAYSALEIGDDLVAKGVEHIQVCTAL
jgi:hypothetical protein